MDWRERETVDAAVCHAQAFLHHLRHSLAALLPIACAAILSILPGTCLGEASKGDAPNIVILLVDDLGYADLGCQSIPALHRDSFVLPVWCSRTQKAV